jgi:hypothetical protein
MKRILDIAGDLRLAFWLILAAGAVMWIGSIYASIHYSLIDSLNGVPLFPWFADKGMTNISATWWIPAMFFIFLLLGINTLACTLRRVMVLVPRRKSLGTKKFTVLLSPSLIHLLFMFMLAGHFLSFTAVSQDKIPLTEGEKINVQGLGMADVVLVKNEFFPETSLLKNRISQSVVELLFYENGKQVNVRIAFLEPAVVKGIILQLDMERKKRERIIMPDPADDNCNKEKKFHYADIKTTGKPQLFLMVTKDPGLIIHHPAFTIVILLMRWYFYQTGISKYKNELPEQVNGNEII